MAGLRFLRDTRYKTLSLTPSNDLLAYVIKALDYLDIVTSNVDSESNPLLSTFELSPALVAYIVAFFQYIGLFSIFPLYIQITQQLSDVEVVEIWAIISGIALLVGALTRIPAGLLSDKIGRFAGYLIAYAVYFLGLLVILSISNNIIYVFAMALIRFGSNMVAMSSRALVSTSFRDIGLKNGLLQAFAGAGSFAGPLVLGYVLDQYAPNVVLYVSILVVLLDLIIFLGLYYGINYWATKNQYEIDLNYSPIKNHEQIDYISVLKRYIILEIFILFFIAGLMFGLLQSIYSIYGYNILQLSATIIGIITGIGALSQTFAAPIAGRLHLFIQDETLRIAAWLILMISGLISALSVASILFFYIAYFVLNIGMSSYFTIEISRLTGIIQPKEFSFTFGIASSMVILATSVAGFISPYLYSIVPEMNFYVTFVLGFFGLALVLITTPKWRNSRES